MKNFKELKVGEYYRQRNGALTQIVRDDNDDSDFPYCSSHGCTYGPNGRWTRGGATDEDLVEHVIVNITPVIPDLDPQPEVGQTWRTRGGAVATIVRARPEDGEPYEYGVRHEDGILTWHYRTGKPVYGRSEAYDLIELIEEAAVEKPKLQLRVGGVYERRDGEVRMVTGWDGGGTYYASGMIHDPDGRARGDSEYDLIREITDGN